MSAYSNIYERSLRDPIGFWDEAARCIDWIKPYRTVFDRSHEPFYKWFSDGQLNTCFNCVDRHILAGNGQRTALIYDSPVTNTSRRISYQQLREEVGRCAGALRRLGVEKGDRVLIFMPNIPEAVVTMLACARLGAVHSVVFGGFASPELAARIDDAKPKVVAWASCGIEPSRIVPYQPLLEGALQLTSHRLNGSIVVQRSQCEAVLQSGRDYEWNDLMAGAVSVDDCVSVLATDPLYILYTSGTTGRPKGVVRDNGGHAVALSWSMPNIYGVNPGDVYWSSSDIGWQVGHSYIVYGPLISGCTSILYEGKPVGTPDAGAFWRVISQYGAKVFFTAPTAFRAIKRSDPEGEFLKKYNLSTLNALFLAGERADPDTIKWAERLLGVPVIDHWWQTESGWPICANPMGLGMLPVKYGSTAVAMPGYDVTVLDNGGQPVNAGEIGNVVIKLPLPPGCFPTLWNNDEGFIETYLRDFPGYYKTADAGFRDEDGYLWIMARTDDIINVAGHRLSTGSMEEIIAGHPDVAECAVVGVHDDLRGQTPIGFIVLKNGVKREQSHILSEVVERVRQHIGPVAAFKRAILVEQLPKTRSGKVLRSAMRAIADSQPLSIPPTIDDPAVLDQIRDALRQSGFR